MFFLKDEGGHFARIASGENEYSCIWGEVDYCVVILEISQEGMTIDIGGITHYGTRARLT